MLKERDQHKDYAEGVETLLPVREVLFVPALENQRKLQEPLVKVTVSTD